MQSVSRVWLVGAVILVLLAGGLQAPSSVAWDEVEEAAEDQLALSREHLKAGRKKEAWGAALAASELVPEDVEVLGAASIAAEALEQNDDALWMAHRALVAARRDGWKAKALQPLVRRVEKLDPLPAQQRPDLTLRARRLLEVANGLAKRKLYANAVDFLRRCRGTPVEDSSEKALEKLYANHKAVDALVLSGIDVPIVDRDSRLARRMTRKDPEHEAWKEAWEIKSRNYTIKTNLPWIRAREISAAMEQMQGYYTEFYLGKRGKKTARCSVDVYKDVDEFVDGEPGAGDALGFFMPGQNRIVTYDPRSEGGAFEEVWETLFHEASHQFMHVVCSSFVATWLNEGTASYFEGARLRPTGRVEANYVAEHRLANLVETLNEGKPTLQEAIEYPGPGSYPAEFYCVGWGIVYFLKNFEDDQANRIYEPHYEALVRSYRSAEKHDQLGRFVEYFVKRPKRPGIATFEEFEKHWRAWIEDLHVLTFGGQESADRLLARARRQRAHGKDEAAHESYRWALQKMPDHPACLFEIGEMGEKRGEKDVALYRYRELAQQLAEVTDAETPVRGLDDVTAGALRETCMNRVRAIAPDLAEVEGKLREEFIASIRTAADRYVAASHPRSALFVLHAAQQSLGGDQGLADKARELRTQTGVDARGWRRIPVTRSLRSWWRSGEWMAVKEALSVSEEERATAFPRGARPMHSYRVEASVRLRPLSSEGFAGIAFGDDGRGIHDVFGLRSGKRLELNRVIEDLTRRQELSSYDGASDRWVRLAVEVDGTHVRFYADDELVGERDYTPDELEGRVGVYVEGAVGDFKDFRIRG